MPIPDAGPSAVPGTALRAQRLPELERSLARVALEAGEVLFREGDAGDSLYVVVAGRVRLLAGEPGAERAIRDLGPGELVGESALLTGEPRTATVIAVRDTELYRLSPQSAGRCLVADLSAMCRSLTTLARRPAGARTGVSAAAEGRPCVRSIALAAAGDTAPAEVARFGELLGAFLSRHLQVAVLSRRTVEAAVGAGATAGQDTAEPAGLTGWLSDQEDRHDLVVYLPSDGYPGPEATGPPAGAPGFWDRLCVRQADVVLLVARADASPKPGPAEQRLLAGRVTSSTRRELVLLHDGPKTVPGRTAKWLSERQLSLAHHVVAGRPAHLGRLARFLIGRPVGVVLSGGGVRGFGHVGVLRALQEHGIPVDVICGTSAGALVGGQFAMGWDAEALERRNVKLFGGPRRRLMDYTIPTTSIVGSVSLNRILNSVFADRQVEDLWIPFLCTISDLTAAELIVRSTGSLRDAVRASCSLPVLLPPVVSPDGHLLADGGVLNNLPVTPLISRMAVGPLIAVNTASTFYTADEAYGYSDSLSLSRMVRSRLNPLAPRLVTPGIAQVLLRALEVGSKSLEPEQIARADVYIRPSFDSSSYTDTTRLPSIIRAGHEAACQTLSTWDSSGILFR